MSHVGSGSSATTFGDSVFFTVLVFDLHDFFATLGLDVALEFAGFFLGVLLFGVTFNDLAGLAIALVEFNFFGVECLVSI